MRRITVFASSALVALSSVVTACGEASVDPTRDPTSDVTADSSTVTTAPPSSTDPSASPDPSPGTSATSGTLTTGPATSRVTTTTGTPAQTGKVTYTTTKVGSLEAAVDVVERTTTDGFVYIVSRLGTVERWRHDGTRIDRVLDVTSSTTGEGERGLLGLAFRRGTTGAWVAYVNMTDSSGDTTIVRHEVTPDGRIDPAGTVILRIDQPYSNHNGGDLRIGPDNMLYIATGDGGSSGDPDRRALDPTSLLGKVLRIDPDRTGYSVPPDNPWVGTAGARPEIWSIGLRNPWRFTFDTAGNMWIADVGQGEIEEATVARADGATPGGRKVNFGWSAWEGTRRYNDDQDAPGSLEPFVEYTHDDGRCSISGAAIGTDRAVPGRRGWFFYGDYCSGDLWATLAAPGAAVRTERIADDIEGITSVRATSAGLWVTTLSGAVYEVTTTRS